MSYKVSLSNIFKQQLAEIAEFDTITNSKRVIQNTRKTAKELEQMKKSEKVYEITRLRSPVENTNYVVVYKIKKNPDKLIVRRIIRCK